MTVTSFTIANNNDMCALGYTKARGFGETDDQLWRNMKFAQTGTTVTVGPGGTGAVGAIGVLNQYATTGLGIIQNIDSYYRWDTSSLDASEDVTAVTFNIWMRDTPASTLSGFSGTESLMIYGGLTGGSDRPDFSSPLSSTADLNWYCESAKGCSSTTCNENGGATLLATAALSGIPSGTTGSPTAHTITLSAGTNADTGSATLFNDWINRSGYTYLYITTNTIYNTSSSSTCSNTADTKLWTLGASALTVNWYSWGGAGGGATDMSKAPQLAVTQAETKRFQMII
jgi:hypothetical protein